MKYQSNLGGFDPNEFTIPAEDQFGHSSRVWARVQPGIDMSLGRMVDSKMFPYRSKSDLMRHAIRRHMTFLESISPLPLMTVSGQVAAIEELMREELYLQQFATMTIKLHDMVNDYLANGEEDKARSLVARIAAKIDDMPEGPWRDKYRKDISDKFSRLFKARGVLLSEWSED